MLVFGFLVAVAVVWDITDDGFAGFVVHKGQKAGQEIGWRDDVGAEIADGGGKNHGAGDVLKD